MTVIAKCLSLLIFFLSAILPPPPSYFYLPHLQQREKLQRQLVTLVTLWSPEQLNNIVLKLSLLLSVSLNFLVPSHSLSDQ